jgi:hypothetical protein
VSQPAADHVYVVDVYEAGSRGRDRAQLDHPTEAAELIAGFSG